MKMSRTEKILLSSAFAMAGLVGLQHWDQDLRYPVEDAQKVLAEAGYKNVEGGQRRDYLCGKDQPARLFYHLGQGGAAEPVVVCYGASGAHVRPS